jgi:hypothetical protein
MSHFSAENVFHPIVTGYENWAVLTKFMWWGMFHKWGFLVVRGRVRGAGVFCSTAIENASQDLWDDHHFFFRIIMITIWLFNIAMENHQF